MPMDSQNNSATQLGRFRLADGQYLSDMARIQAERQVAEALYYKAADKDYPLAHKAEPYKAVQYKMELNSLERTAMTAAANIAPMLLGGSPQHN